MKKKKEYRTLSLIIYILTTRVEINMYLEFILFVSFYFSNMATKKFILKCGDRITLQLVSTELDQPGEERLSVASLGPRTGWHMGGTQARWEWMSALETGNHHSGLCSGPAGGARGSGSPPPMLSVPPQSPLCSILLLQPAFCPSPGAQPVSPPQAWPPYNPCGALFHLWGPDSPAPRSLDSLQHPLLTASPDERTAGRPLMPPKKLQAVPGLKAHSRGSKKAHHADFPEMLNLQIGRQVCQRRAGLPLWN